ncbi:hypothetical protein DH2020_040450 [Rehmannia glutinosa]|uniref:Reverse transcriptase domain-containing protein n=1 Tax=Rehmannia glutinosa TaxID=99300 RepID=A0ABR0UU41_REHGL
MCHQRARANWIKDGDKNTGFFHKLANGRQARNSIDRIMTVAGGWVEDHNDIVKEFGDYYRHLFAAEEQLDMEVALNAIDRKATKEMNDLLNRHFETEKVVAALAQMHPTKSPGPDGMPALFYHKFWSFIKSDILSATLKILNNESSPKSINDTFIVLIPKKKKPERVTDYRPISLCNVIFKLVTKTIANRLKLILPDLIHHTQSAFVPGRLITDNAMLALRYFII